MRSNSRPTPVARTLLKTIAPRCRQRQMRVTAKAGGSAARTRRPTRSCEVAAMYPRSVIRDLSHSRLASANLRQRRRNWEWRLFVTVRHASQSSKEAVEACFRNGHQNLGYFGKAASRAARGAPGICSTHWADNVNNWTPPNIGLNKNPRCAALWQCLVPRRRSRRRMPARHLSYRGFSANGVARARYQGSKEMLRTL